MKRKPDQEIDEREAERWKLPRDLFFSDAWPVWAPVMFERACRENAFRKMVRGRMLLAAARMAIRKELGLYVEEGGMTSKYRHPACGKADPLRHDDWDSVGWWGNAVRAIEDGNS